MRNISNSEVTTWLSCVQQYHFAFGLNITPKETPKPLARGTLLHGCFEAYVRARLEGASHEKALAAAQAWLTSQLALSKMEYVLEVKILFDRYMAFHKGWPEWRLLGTEERVDLPINADITFPIRYDLYFEEIPTGRRGILDFKSAYDFWTPDNHALNGQMPKYITVMNHNGLQVDFGVLEEIRTRKLGEEKASDPRNLWRRTRYNPSVEKQRNMLRQHIGAAIQITNYKALPEKEQEALRVPVLAMHGACKFCNFKELCASQIDGGDIALEIEMGYVQNTYGYNKSIDDNIEDYI